MLSTYANEDQAAWTMVAGVGGAGCNAVARLIERATRDLKIICANTDARALRSAPAHHRMQLGPVLTKGLGTGANPALGRAAAQEVLPDIVEALNDVKLCFVVAGVGGGTGSGAAPVVARAARDMGILTIGIVIKPFAFEGNRRNRAADAAIQKMEESFDALMVVCNDNLLRVAHPATTFQQSLAFSDSIVVDSILDLSAMIEGPALKRISVADLRSVLVPGGRTVIGHGNPCRGNNRAARAAESAMSNPLLDDVATGARHVLVTITGGSDLGLFELEQAVAQVRAMISPDAELVWGSAIDPALDGVVRVGIAAAGLPPRESTQPAHQILAMPHRSSCAPIKVPVCVSPSAAADPDPLSPEQATLPISATPISAVAAAAHDAVASDSLLPIPADLGDDRPTVDPDPDLGEDTLDLVENYQLDLTRARRPARATKIYSRGHSPSLVDRIHFATVSLKNRVRRDVDRIDALVAARVS